MPGLEMANSSRRLTSIVLYWWGWSVGDMKAPESFQVSDTTQLDASESELNFINFFCISLHKVRSTLGTLGKVPLGLSKTLPHIHLKPDDAVLFSERHQADYFSFQTQS